MGRFEDCRAESSDQWGLVTLCDWKTSGPTSCSHVKLQSLKQERFKTAVEQELADASQLGCEAGPESMLDPTINVLHSSL